MQLSVLANDNQVVRLQLAGRVDQDVVNPDCERLREELGDDAYKRHVLLDMSDVEMLDSSGVAWLLAEHKRCREAGGKLVLHSLSLLARNVLRVLNMHLVLKIVADEDDAVQVLRGDAS